MHEASNNFIERNNSQRKENRSLKSKAVQKIFSQVPETYELINHLFTWGADILCRKQVARLACGIGGVRWLDICTGTGEMATYLQQVAPAKTAVYGLDFSGPMLSVARDKPQGERINFMLGDATVTPFPDGSFDLITISFATRNLGLKPERLTKTFREFWRILKPGGTFLHLETSQPQSRLIRWFFHLYIRLMVRTTGVLISGQKAAYRYLAYTIPHFYPAPQLVEIFRPAGFQSKAVHAYLCGAVALHVLGKS